MDSVSGFHGVHGPQTVHRPRYKAELKDPVIQAAKSMGYKVVDPNAYSQRGKYAYTQVCSINGIASVQRKNDSLRRKFIVASICHGAASIHHGNTIFKGTDNL